MREEPVLKANFSMRMQLMQPPASQFKAKKFNKNIFKGVFGIPAPQERPST